MPKLEGCEAVLSRTGFEGKFCPIGAIHMEKATFGVLGDSHAEALAPGIGAAAQRAGVRGILIHQRVGCPPLLGLDRHHQGYDDCPDGAAATMAYLKAHPEIATVFLVARWSTYIRVQQFHNEEGAFPYIKDSHTQTLSFEENERVFRRSFEQTLAQLSSLNRRVIVVTSVPVMKWNVPKTAARALLFNRDIEFRPSLGEYTDRQAFVTAVFNENKDRYGLSFIHPDRKMCDAQYCAVFDGGKPVYSDHNHITKTYALKLSYLFDPIFQAMAHKQEFPPRDAHN